MPVTTPAFFEVTNCLTLNYDNSYYVLKNNEKKTTSSF